MKTSLLSSARVIAQPLPTSLRNDSDIMKIDMTTNIDREMGQIGLTAKHSSRPVKVFFLPTHIFCFLRADTQLAHCLLPDTQAYGSQKSKSQFLPAHGLNGNII